MKEMPGSTVHEDANVNFDDNKAYVPQEEEGEAFVGGLPSAGV